MTTCKYYCLSLNSLSLSPPSLFLSQHLSSLNSLHYFSLHYCPSVPFFLPLHPLPLSLPPSVLSLSLCTLSHSLTRSLSHSLSSLTFHFSLSLSSLYCSSLSPSGSGAGSLLASCSLIGWVFWLIDALFPTVHCCIAVRERLLLLFSLCSDRCLINRVCEMLTSQCPFSLALFPPSRVVAASLLSPRYKGWCPISNKLANRIVILFSRVE